MPLALIWTYGRKALASPLFWIAIAVAVLAVQNSLLKHARADAQEWHDKYDVQADLVKSETAANQTNQTTIGTLQAQIQTMVDERALDAAKAAALLAQREDQIASVQAAAAAERRKRSEVWNGSQSCQALATTRVSDVCGPLADSLRNRTAHH